MRSRVSGLGAPARLIAFAIGLALLAPFTPEVAR